MMALLQPIAGLHPDAKAYTETLLKDEDHLDSTLL